MNPLTRHGWLPADKAREVHLQVQSLPSTIEAEVEGSRARHGSALDAEICELPARLSNQKHQAQ